MGFSVFAELCICFEKANPKLRVHTDTWHLQENVQCKVESGIYGISTMTMHLLSLLCLSGESLATNVIAHPSYSHDLVQ